MAKQRLSVPKFIQFINEQKTCKRIDHNRWETCAVGDYWEASGHTRNKYEPAAEKFRETLKKVNPDLYWKLNNCDDCELTTYGRLQKFIKEQEKAA